MKELTNAFMCGLAILGTARFLELIGTTVTPDPEKRKRLSLELSVALVLLTIIILTR